MLNKIATETDDTVNDSDHTSAKSDPLKRSNRHRRKLTSRLMMVARRTHLYAGLFLLPWVFLYGITGAMFNHAGLFPRFEFRSVPNQVVTESGMSEFPTPDALAAQVVEAIQSNEDGSTIELAPQPNAEFTNDLMFEVTVDGKKHVVHLDPISNTAHLATHPPEDFKPKRMLRGINNIRLQPNPLETASDSAREILAKSGVETEAKPTPFGWTKLNFLARVNDRPARITYVLKDGHVDITEYEGHHGMPVRGFFLRLHTTHGQPPHWNGRMIWSLFVDAMAIAMVTWGLTGLLMWWQIKRTRLIGGLVMLASVLVAAAVYFMVYGFYARTLL